MLDFSDTRYLGYRVGKEYFARIVDAECYKIDTGSRFAIEMFYKDRWHIVGGKPEVKRIAI